MKIGFDVSQTCVEKAGCGYYADSLARALAESFPEHEIILYHHFGRWCNESTQDGTRIDLPNVTEPMRDWTREEAQSFWSSEPIDCSALGDPDVVIANSFQMPAIPDTKTVFTVYDISIWTHPDFHTGANRIGCQRGLLEAIKNADAFSFISEYSKHEFDRVFPGWLSSKQKSSVVTPLAPRAVRQAYINDNLDQRDYWLFVGSLEPRKNVGTLLDAYDLYFKQSSSPKPLKLAGGAGWKSENTKYRINQLSESMPIEHLGYVSDDELERLYANAFTFIFPSWYEGFGLPVVEAMNQGTPVITTLESSLEEIAEDYALSFNPNSADELCAKMLEIESNSDKWQSYQKLSLERADNFNWGKTAKELCKVLN